MDTTSSTPSPIGMMLGTHLLVLGGALEPALDAEHAGDREAPDVGVEHADPEALGGQRGGQVHGDRGLAHAALARGDGDDPGGGGHGGVGRRLLHVPAGPGHGVGLLLGVHLGPVELHAGHAGERLDPGDDVLLDLGPQRAAGGGEGDGDGDEAVVGRRRRALAMPRSTMSLPSSGSMTPRSSAMTSSLGGGVVVAMR